MKQLRFFDVPIEEWNHLKRINQVQQELKQAYIYKNDYKILRKDFEKFLKLAEEDFINEKIIDIEKARTKKRIEDGLITIEDLLEEITGEIEDEHDTNFNRILNDNLDNSIIVDARIPIIELENYYSCKLINSSIEVDTLGGLIFYYEKSVPEVGKSIKHSNGLIFEIIESDMRRIKKIKITGTPKV